MIDKGPNTDTYLQQILEVSYLSGDIAECGVYKGYNTYYYASLLKNISSNKTIHAFDTFCGFPKDSEDNVNLNRFDDVDFNNVTQLLSSFSNVCIHKGIFEKCFSDVSNNKFCCVILDCDLYESYKTSLRFFYPLLVSGGIIILDEYYSKKYLSPRFAVDDFCKTIEENPEIFHIELNGWERWRILKK